jgi:hypothetical protein
VGWAGCAPGGPTWPLGRLVRWSATPTGTGAGSSAPPPCRGGCRPMAEAARVLGWAWSAAPSTGLGNGAAPHCRHCVIQTGPAFLLQAIFTIWPYPTPPTLTIENNKYYFLGGNRPQTNPSTYSQSQNAPSGSWPCRLEGRARGRGSCVRTPASATADRDCLPRRPHVPFPPGVLASRSEGLANAAQEAAGPRKKTRQLIRTVDVSRAINRGTRRHRRRHAHRCSLVALAAFSCSDQRGARGLRFFSNAAVLRSR